MVITIQRNWLSCGSSCIKSSQCQKHSKELADKRQHTAGLALTILYKLVDLHLCGELGVKIWQWMVLSQYYKLIMHPGYLAKRISL